MKNIKQYYKELGKMVYAIAAVDGVIKTEEAEALHIFVQKDLATNEAHLDSSGMNEAFYVDFEFEDSTKTKPDINATLKSYAKFIHNNYEQADANLINRSVKLLHTVADAYNREKENEVVMQIKSEINEISKSILLLNKK
jgi:hypothetical protein